MGNKNAAVETPQLLFGEVTYWIVIVSNLIATIGPVFVLFNPKNNMLDPTLLFAEIWKGANPEAIWNTVGSGLEEGHSYLYHLTTGDGITQFGIALGCSVALWGLIPAMIQYVREKDFMNAIFCLISCLLIALAMFGLVSME